MGTIIRFPQRHARASVLNPKTAGSASLPRPAKASRTSRKLSLGILPRSRQLLTADDPTPSKEAAAAVPPSASTTSSTEFSMPLDTSQSVKMSSLHVLPIVTDRELRQIGTMARSTEDIAKRLAATQQALGLSAAELCRQSGLSENQWSQYTNPKAGRPITRQQLYKLKDTFGITFEWVYDGDPSRLPHELALKLRKSAAA